MVGSDSEQGEVYKVHKSTTTNKVNLVSGPNVISFTTGSLETGLHTFHHACLYIIPNSRYCFVIDSWSTSKGETFNCRPLEVKLFYVDHIIQALNRLNSHGISPKELIQIFNAYFIPVNPDMFATKVMNGTIRSVNVYTVNPSFIKRVFAICKDRITSGKQTKSAYGGGKPRNKTRKLRKKSKRCSKHKT